MADTENQPNTENTENSATTDNAANAESETKNTQSDAQPSTPNASTDQNNTGTDTDAIKGEAIFDPTKMNLLNDIAIPITIEVGRTKIKIRDLLALNKGSILELDKLAGDPVDIYANGKLIALGNIITANGKYCVRLMSVNENKNTEVKSDSK